MPFSLTASIFFPSFRSAEEAEEARQKAQREVRRLLFVALVPHRNRCVDLWQLLFARFPSMPIAGPIEHRFASFPWHILLHSPGTNIFFSPPPPLSPLSPPFLSPQGKLKAEDPENPPFDSNCITPGTPFMIRLQEHLEYFVKVKLSTEPTWQVRARTTPEANAEPNFSTAHWTPCSPLLSSLLTQGVEVILSGNEVPGEGEHKIMDYIRAAKLQPDYDANTRHCMYGLDADLVRALGDEDEGWEVGETRS
jgi:5'-3' exonuclease